MALVEIGGDHRAEPDAWMSVATQNEHYDVPICSSKNDETCCITSNGEAMSYLRRTLAPLFPKYYILENSSKPFHFFKLPPEIRAKIYDMVFVYPGGALSVHEYYRQTGIKLHSYGRDVEGRNAATRSGNLLPHLCDRVSLGGPKPPVYELIRATKILRPLRVCKQFLQEALPVFFGKNTFLANSLNYLHQVLTRLSPSRRGLITSVAFA